MTVITGLTAARMTEIQADLEAADTAEAAARVAADTALDARVDTLEGVTAEVSQAELDAEATARANGDAAEAAARAAAVTAEETARIGGDNALDARLDIIEASEVFPGAANYFEEEFATDLSAWTLVSGGAQLSIYNGKLQPTTKAGPKLITRTGFTLVDGALMAGFNLYRDGSHGSQIDLGFYLDASNWVDVYAWLSTTGQLDIAVQQNLAGVLTAGASVNITGAFANAVTSGDKTWLVLRRTGNWFVGEFWQTDPRLGGQPSLKTVPFKANAATFATVAMSPLVKLYPNVNVVGDTTAIANGAGLRVDETYATKYVAARRIGKY